LEIRGKTPQSGCEKRREEFEGTKLRSIAVGVRKWIPREA
jgi:hypothetical protein